MARVTVEDCVKVVPNRFELVLLAAQRARDISAGQDLSVDRDNDKNPVIALREIADGKADLDSLRNHISRGVNRNTELTAEDEVLRALPQAAEEQWSEMEELSMDESQIEEVTFGDEDSSEEAMEASSDDEPTAEDLESDEDFSMDISVDEDQEDLNL